MKELLPQKIGLYALSLLSIERRGVVDSIVLPSSFAGEFDSFARGNPNPSINLEGKSFSLYNPEIYFQGQPIGLFTHPSSLALASVVKETRVYYSQEESLFPFSHLKTQEWQSFDRKDLKENQSKLFYKKTEFSPAFPAREMTRTVSIIFESTSENSAVLWIPCPLSPFLQDLIKTNFKTFPTRIVLKSMYQQYSDINLSLLGMVLCQLVQKGLETKKTIWLHAELTNLKKRREPKILLTSYFSQDKPSTPLYYEMSLTLPYSLRWQYSAFVKMIKGASQANLFPKRIVLTISFQENHPIFYSHLEDVATPLSDLIHNHIERHLRDPKLSYYKGYFDTPTKKRTVLNLLKAGSDYARKNYSYARQEIFSHEKFSFGTKKGIGLSLFNLNLDLSHHSFDFSISHEKQTITLSLSQCPLNTTSLALFEKELISHIPHKKGHTFSLKFQEILGHEPLLKEEWDWLIDRPLVISSHPLTMKSRPSITFEPILLSRLIGCIVELRVEPWIYSLKIMHIHVVMQSGKRTHLSQERDRVLTMIQDFLDTELPSHFRIEGPWEESVEIHILEEGSGSFMNLPYALRGAFFSALRQTSLLAPVHEIPFEGGSPDS